MYQVSYLFLSDIRDPNINQTGQWMLEIRVLTDSGFEKSDDGSEPDPTNFENADTSMSSIAIYAWYCTGPANLNWSSGVWSTRNQPIDGEVVEFADRPFKVFRKDLNPVDLPNRAAVRDAAAQFKVEASEALGANLT